MPDRTFAVHHRNLLVELIAPFLLHRLGLPILDKTLYAILSQPRSIALRALRHYSSQKGGRNGPSIGDIVLYLVRKITLSNEESFFKSFLADMAGKGHTAVVEEMLRARVRPIFDGCVRRARRGGEPFVGLRGWCRYPQWCRLQSASHGGWKREYGTHAIAVGGHVHVVGETVHQAAAESRKLEMVKLVLEHGADISSDAVRSGAIRSAALGGNPAVVEYILDRRGHVQFDSDAMLLQVVTGRGQMETAKVVLDRGVVRPRDPRLLHHAFNLGSVAVTKILLDHGIGDPSKELLAAARGHHAVILDLLLERGADVHTDGDSALRIATTSMFGLEAIQLFLDRGADIHACQDAALRDAALSDQKGNVVRGLLDRGADIHSCNDQALVNARARRNDQVVQILLERGADRSVLDDMERIMQAPRWPEDEDFDDESFLIWLATGEYPR